MDGAELKALRQLARNERPVILCFWHNRIVFFAGLMERELLRRGFRLTMMSSLSKDGQIGAILGTKAGAEVVRGSSSREGSRGLRALYRAAAKQRNSIVILPDGSQGPVYQAKLGAIVLAKMTGCPILPMSYSASRYWTIDSWDRMIFPKPFSRIRLRVGEALEVDREADDGEMERARQKLEDTLNELTRETEAACGRGEERPSEETVSVGEGL